MMEIISSIGVVTVLFLLIYLWIRCCFASGKITLAPSEGTLRVATPFKPCEVYLNFCGQSSIPGCSQLEDSIRVESMDYNGFMVRYKIKSGTRVVEWKAYA